MKIVKRENWGRAWEEKSWNFDEKGRRERERDCEDEEEKGQKGKLVSHGTLRIMQQNEAELTMIF